MISTRFIAASLLMLAMALVHHAVLAQPLSASIGAPLTVLLLIAGLIGGFWLGLRYEVRRRKRKFR